MTEWQDDIFIQLMRFNKGKVDDPADPATLYNASTTALYSKENFFLDRDNKENGDMSGRVPVSTKQVYHLVMLNYNAEKDQTLKLQYGAAVQTAVLSATALVSALTAVYLF